MKNIFCFLEPKIFDIPQSKKIPERRRNIEKKFSFVNNCNRPLQTFQFPIDLCCTMKGWLKDLFHKALEISSNQLQPFIQLKVTGGGVRHLNFMPVTGKSFFLKKVVLKKILNYPKWWDKYHHPGIFKRRSRNFRKCLHYPLSSFAGGPV